MFKENQNGGPQEADTIIGPSVKLEGDFITEGNIIVDGIVCGTVKTAKNLRVGAKSKIFANVSADNAFIAGEVQGNLKIKNKLELTNTAKIFGDIKADIVIMAGGANLVGRCQAGDEKNKTPKPDFSRQEKIELKSTGQTETVPPKSKNKK